MKSQPPPLTVELEISEREPPVGWLRAAGRERRRFGGWLELFSSLHAVLDEPSDQHSRGAIAITDRGQSDGAPGRVARR